MIIIIIYNENSQFGLYNLGLFFMTFVHFFITLELLNANDDAKNTEIRFQAVGLCISAHYCDKETLSR